MLSSLGLGLAGVSPVVAVPKEAPSVFVPDAGAEADKSQNAAPAFEEILLVTATARKESSGDLPWVTEQLDAQVLLADELSSRDRADVQRIPPGGTPGYAIWTVRGGWDLGERRTLSAAVENLTDEDYRIHGSGLNQPGRNFVASMQIRF